MINRVDWAGVIKPPEANELGWKDTVRMNPLEDAIVALRPVAPKTPFGIADSVRPLERLWGRIGLVPQAAYLFKGTVAENLRFGNESASNADLWRALEVAQARDFVASMPAQLEATVDQGGTNVSGGQRQRLAIARALVKRPAIYLFDDCFSALDAATDARLRMALRAETTDATVVIVAQRVSTILHADRIIVIDEGRIVGSGTHAELMVSSSEYREIVESQLGESAA